MVLAGGEILLRGLVMLFRESVVALQCDVMVLRRGVMA